MIKLRAHHLLCLSRNYATKDEWYNKKLTQHAHKIHSRLIKNPNLKIKIIKKCDDICKKCPHRKGKICKKREKINYWIKVMDNKVLRLIKIKPNTKHKASELFKLTINNITNKDLRDICRGCEFLKNCIKYRVNKSFVNSI
ncbi:DUF1284 domain-containing protein [Candidatus Pacearchaeota archaeon]|nr:DUF1284 domain-containing protein [Candidatus Pacearchaeota archaeon]